MKLPKRPSGRLRRLGLRTYSGACVAVDVDAKGWVWAKSPREVMHPYRIETAQRCKLTK